jgi:hypothetical protein
MHMTTLAFGPPAMKKPPACEFLGTSLTVVTYA